MMSRFFLSAILFALVPAGVFAQSAKPLPNPDLSKLTPDASSAAREARANFDKASVGQSGVALAEMYGDLGALYARVQLVDAAAVAFENAALAAPLDDRWIYLRGVIARGSARPAEARTFFERAVRLNPMFLPARIALSAELLRAGDLDGARSLLNNVLDANRDQPALHAVLGDIAFRQKQYPVAVQHLTEAIRLDPKATNLYAALARVEDAAGNAKAATEARGKAGDVPPRLDDPLLQRVLPLAGAPSPATASTAQSAATTDPKQLTISEANFSAATGNYDAARAALDKSLKQHPNDLQTLVAYARIEASAGKLDAARARARAAVAADPKSVQAWMIQGLISEMANDDSGARDAYQKALSVDAKAARAQMALGNIALRNGKASDAVTAYRALVTIAPKDIDGWARLLAAESVAGQCAAAVRETSDNATREPRNALLVELHIRAVSTCPAATSAQKQVALAEGQKLYAAATSNLAQVAEAYALALAANGKWTDAAQTQGAAVYEAVRAGDQTAVAQYREFYQRFQAKQMPTRPWADSHPLLKPQRPAPVAAKTVAPTPK